MLKHKVALGAVLAALAVGLLSGQALSQQAAPQRQDRGGGGAPGGGRFDPERMRQAYMDRIKEALAATDEDWKVLAPRIEKVQNLSGQLRGGRMGMVGGRGGRGDRTEGAAQPARELTGVEKALQNLRTTLENKDAKPDEIKNKLQALREAREKAKQELAQAQDELRKILTARQEAQLVLMGLLD